MGIVHRRQLASADDGGALRAELGAAYAEEHLTAAAAASCGFIDEVIEPESTRERLGWALSSLEGAR